MKTKRFPIGIAAVLSLLMAPLSATAQPRSEDGLRAGGGRSEGRPREDRRGRRGSERRGPAGSQRQLIRLWGGISELRTGSSALSNTQAKRIMDLLRPWLNRPKMSGDEASRLDAQLRAVLTGAQESQLEAGQPRFGRGFQRGDGAREGRSFGGPGRDGGLGRDSGREARGGPSGRGKGRGENGGGFGRDRRSAGGGDPQKREQMRAFFENYNPFYSPTGYVEWKTLPTPMQERIMRNYKAGRTTLEALSRQSRA